MKKLFTLLFCAALLGASAGCSDDKDDATVDAALLVGAWKETAIYDGEYDEWYYTNLSPYLFRLNADGTGSDQDTFTWTCSGSTLILNFDYGDVSEGNIDLLTETELVVSGSYRGEDGGIYTDVTYYERVE